jgi:two-component system response regulator PhoP
MNSINEPFLNNQFDIAIISNHQDRLTAMVNDLVISKSNTSGYLDSITFFKILLTNSISLLIIDLAYSEEDDLSIERYLAINPNLIIFVIADTNLSSYQKIAFLEAGADKVLINPINNNELLANIIAAFRTQNKANKSEQQSNINSEKESSWRLCSFKWTLSAPNQKLIQLTQREFKLIEFLIYQPGETVNKHFLAEKILGKFNQNGSRRMDLLVGRLRNKALEELQVELPIKTVHSIGYVFTSKIMVD